MKKVILALSIAFACTTAISAQKSAIINEVLDEHVIRKVSYAQELIRFSDTQAKRLKEVEMTFLLGVRQAECRSCGNTDKRIKKLQTVKDAALQEILRPDEYIKYKAIEDKSVKPHPLWSK